MLLATAAVIFGLLLLVWSADKFVDGAAATAGHLGYASAVDWYGGDWFWYLCTGTGSLCYRLNAR